MLLYTFLAACFRISKVSIWLFAGFQTVKYIFTHSNTSSQRSSFVFVSQMNVSYENAGWSRPWWWKVSDQGGFNKFSLPQLSPEARLLDVLNPLCVCLCVSCEGSIMVQVRLTSGLEQAFTAHTDLPLWTWIRVDLFVQTSEVLELFLQWS